MAKKLLTGVHCPLCKKVRPLTATDCCKRPICDPMFGVSGPFVPKGSCWVRHARFTLCGSHHAEGHQGEWNTCKKCLKSFETEMYVYYGTNKYNFEKLENPPSYEPTLCGTCGGVIVLSRGGFSLHPDGSFHHGGCDPID